jgi:subtilisin family serine protease
VSETRRYNLTLRKVPRVERDKFRALRRPDTYFEIRPGDVGERVAYSVEMTPEEYEQARRAADDPRSNLIVVEEVSRGQLHSVPDHDNLVYVAAQNLPQLGLTGRGVTVAVVDTGLGAGLAAKVFAGRVKAAKSFVGADPLTDPGEHGSGMASIAVPAQASIAVAQVWAAGNATDDKLAAGIYWATDEAQADVINISLGSYADAQVTRDAIAHAVSRGVLIFVSAGNDGINESNFPADHPGANKITNYDRRTDAKAPSSSYGGSGDSAGVFAAANGMAVDSYDSAGNLDYHEDGETSSACAMATRVAASLLQNPDRGSKRDPDMVRHYLAKTARKTGAGPLYEGNGVLQLAAAANAIRKERPECPPGYAPTTKTTYDIRFVQDESGQVVQVK